MERQATAEPGIAGDHEEDAYGQAPEEAYEQAPEEAHAEVPAEAPANDFFAAEEGGDGV